MKRTQTQSGFTLTELAIVLLIVGLLIGGLLIPLSAQNDNKRIADTQKALSDIREALLGFAVVNGRLPCPAQATIASNATNAGVEAVTATGGPCACSTATSGIANIGTTVCTDTSPDSVSGVLPWVTLGLPETDAWGQRYTYRITTRFGRLASGQSQFGCTPSSNPTNAAFALCSAGDMTVNNTSAATPVAVASNVPAIAISHGKNGLGAYTQQGTQLATTGASNDELANTDNNSIFVSNLGMDDLHIWISSPILMNRMLTAGKLP